MVHNYINKCIQLVTRVSLLLMLTLLLRKTVEVDAYATFKFEDFCGFSVSRYESVGILRLNVTTFASRHSYKEKCTVTLSPQPLTGSGGNGRVLFYFLHFWFPGDCGNMNLTLLDENGPTVKGLPEPVCGSNISLYTPGLVFNTTGTSLELQLRWNQFRTKELATEESWQEGGFELAYAAYYEGTCDDETVKCRNGRCSDKAEHCGLINTCGGGEESACVAQEKEKGFWENFTANLAKHAETIAIVIGAIILVYYGFKWLKQIRTRHGSLTNYVKSVCGGNSSSAANQRHDSVSLESVPLESRESRRASLCDSEDSDRRNKTGLAAPPPAYDTIGPRLESCPEPTSQDTTLHEHRPVDDATPYSSNMHTHGRFTCNDSHGPSSTSTVDSTGGTTTQDAQAPPPSYHPYAPPPHGGPQSTPLAPPPSYDEFMANENKH